MPVVVHVGSLTTRAACALASHAAEIGADATSSIPPFYYNVGPEGVKQYYIQVAAASGLPFYIYNIPGTTGVNVAVDVVRELIAAVPNLRGMKYTAYDLYAMRKIVELDDGRFNVLSGADEIMVAAQAMGADGAIGTTENFLPRVFVDAYTAFRCRRREDRGGAAGQDQLDRERLPVVPIPGGRQGDHAAPRLRPRQPAAAAPGADR